MLRKGGQKQYALNVQIQMEAQFKRTTWFFLKWMLLIVLFLYRQELSFKIIGYVVIMEF